MITTRTPLRISLCGGGTDMPSFYQHHPGAVISTGIDKSIYISINPKFDGRFRVSYSRTENVDNVGEIQHDIVREAIKLFQLKGLEVVAVSDIPGEGSGLGSSSAFTVGLLHALFEYVGQHLSTQELAENAFTVEELFCKHSCGKQDHYAAAFGGFRYYEFHPREVKIRDFGFAPEELNLLNSSLLLFWTGLRPVHASEDILKDQSVRLAEGHCAVETGMYMAALTRKLKAKLDDRCFESLGDYVRGSWLLKKRFAAGVTNDWIDDLVGNAMKVGATGAKIAGAGGGGFLLVVADPLYHQKIETAVGLRRVPFQIGARGSHVVYKGE